MVVDRLQGEPVKGRIIAVCSVTAICLAVTVCAPRVGTLGSPSMPDPGGCYVLVYDQPEFMGAREFINGPAKYSTLSALPFRINWRHRIRSARVGLAATVTAWVDENFQGASMTLRAESSYPRLSDAFSGQLESLDVACARSSQNSSLDNPFRRADP
jgi:hypothetical protein